MVWNNYKHSNNYNHTIPRLQTVQLTTMIINTTVPSINTVHSTIETRCETGMPLAAKPQKHKAIGLGVI